MHRWGNTRGLRPYSGVERAHYSRSHRVLSMLAAVLLLSGLFTMPGLLGPDQDAQATNLSTCRDTGLRTSGGNAFDLNGHVVKAGLRIEPIYAKRMYADFRAGYDAMYIGYRIENLTTGGTDRTDLWLSLSDFTPGIQPVNPRQNDVFIGDLNRGQVVTKFFFVKATAFTADVQSHTVALTDALPGTKPPLAECRADIQGVYRSISAKANKVTSVTVTREPTLAVGDIFTITVEGSPGKVGNGSAPDNKVMTLSPANSSSWPAGALELTSLETEFRGVQNVSQCTGVLGGGSRVLRTNNSGKTVTFGPELVFPAVDRCASRPQSAYTTTYTFEVTGTFRNNPVVRPVSDISSGTQIKYTGSYPSDLPAIDFSTITPPDNVGNASVTKTLTSASVVDDKLVAVYQVKAELSGTNPPDVVLDSVSDLPSAGFEFVSATIKDTTRTTAQSITPLVRGTTENPELRFMGPITVSEADPLVLDYTVRYPLPPDGATVTYGNQAFGLIGSYVVFSNGETVGVQGIDLTVTNNGGTITVEDEPTLLAGSPQTISFQLPATTGAGASTELTGYSDSGLPLTYTSLTPDTCAVTEFDGTWTLVALSSGSCQVRATQLGDDFYAAAHPVTRTITVQPGQTISHGTVPVLTGANSFGNLTVSSTSTLAVTLDVLTPDECRLGETTPGPATATIASGSEIRVTAILSGGTCLLSATQPGNEDFGPAPEVLIVIGIGSPQHIQITGLQATADLVLENSGPPQEFQPGAGKIPLDTTFITKATPGVAGMPDGDKTDLPVALTSLTPTVCAVLPPTANADGFLSQLNSAGQTTTAIRILAAGTCTIQADQDGFKENGDESDFAPAPSVQHSFIILPAGTTPQTITLNVGADFVYGDVISRTITATTSSELRAQFERVQGTCTLGSATLGAGGVTSAQVLFTTAGECTIRATQPGNNDFAAATAGPSTIEVSPRPVTLTGLTADDKVYDGTTSATISVVPSGLGLSDVVSGDVAQDIAPVLKAGFAAPTGVFADANVGTHAIDNLDGVELTGSKASSYSLLFPSLAANITQRPLILRPNSQTITSGSAPSQCSPVVVDPTTLAGGDSVDSDTFSCLFGGQAVTETQTETQTITVDESNGPNIVRVSDSTQIVTANYSVTFQTATLTVQQADQEITLEGLTDLVITYGEPLPEDFFTSPSAKRGGQSVDGSLRQKRSDGKELAVGEILAATNGAIEISVEFTESGSDPQTVFFTRNVTVNKRPITYSVTVQSRVYDGTDVVSISGFSLEAISGDSASGPLAGDIDFDEDSLPQTGSLGGQTNVGTHALTWADPPLVGNKQNYLVQRPTAIDVTITKRPIRIQATSANMLVGDPVPSFTLASAEDPTHPNAANRGLAPGRPLSEVLGDNPTVDLPQTLGVGVFDAVPNVPTNDNYDIEKVNGKLYVADIQIDNLQVNTDGLLTDPTFVCSCEGLAPNTDVQVFIFSDPVELTKDITFTTDSNGTCPGSVEFTIPDEIFNATDGADPEHTIKIFGFFPTDDLNAEPGAVRERSVTMAPASLTVTTNPPPVIGTSPPAVVSPRPPQPIQPPLLPAPRVSPNPLAPGTLFTPAPPATGNNTPGTIDQPTRNGGVTTPPNQAPISPNSLRSPLSGVVNRAQDPSNTFDLGVEGLNPGDLVGNGNSSRAGTRTMGEIREERLGGFDPRTALRVEVIGSRTTARFVISTLTGLDELVLIEQITRSSAGNRTNFAGVDGIGIGSPTGPQNPWTLDERDNAYDLFNYSRLDVPTKQSELLGSNSYTWLNVEKGVSGYLPGSTIYLTATSSPVVFGEAEVGPDGQAIVNGDLAVELLGLGEHRIRVIGTRVFQDIQVDADGEVIIPDTVLEQILLFDMGTDATVIVTGNNPTGGVHTVMRVVPLDPVSPWWTLWVIGWTALLLLLARLRGMIRTVMEKAVASGSVLVSSIPALYLGWTTTVTQVAWWGLLMGLGLSLVVWLVPSLRRREEAVA